MKAERDQLGEAGGAEEAALGGAIRLGVEIPIRILSILATLVLTRRLGVTGFGELIATLGVALLIAELSDLGLSQSLIPQIVSRARTATDIYATKGQLTVCMVGVTALALWAIAMLTPLDPIAVGLCVSHYVGASWIECAGNTLRAHGRRFAEGALLMVFRCGFVALIGLTPLGQSPRGVGLAYAIAVIPGGVLGGWLVARHLSGSRTANSWVVLREALPLGINSMLARLNVRVEVFVLRSLDMALALGQFAASLRVIESVLTLPAALAGGALPSLAREAESRGQRPGAAQRTLGLIIWGAVPAAIGLGLRAPEVLALLGSGFVDGVSILRVFSFTLALCFINTALFHFLVSSARGALIPSVTALRLGVGVAFALILIPRFGGLGAAVGYAAAEAIQLAYLVRVARRRTNFSILRPIGAAILGTIPMALVLLVGPRPLYIAVPLAVTMSVAGGAWMLRKGSRSVELG